MAYRGRVVNVHGFPGDMSDLTIILFGMVRRAKPFLDSIDEVLLRELEKRDVAYEVIGYLNSPSLLDNPRSGEYGVPVGESHLRERFPGVTFVPQDEAAIRDQLAEVRTFGDAWEDGFRSLTNLLFQLRSLAAGTLDARSYARCVLFLRPDLVYHDSFANFLFPAMDKGGEGVWLPRWQTWGGLIDRFGLAIGQRAIDAYGLRIQRAAEFVHRRKNPLHSERLLAYSLGMSKIRVELVENRASRCRIDGTLVEENFDFPLRKKIKTFIKLNYMPRLYA